MRILAFESSAKAASVALIQDGVLLTEHFQNNGKTHSATLMPMAKQVLEDCGITAADLDAVAVAKGPGSFTGVRIGVAAAKGLAWGAEKPVCGVSTLEGMANQMAMLSGIICPALPCQSSGWGWRYSAAPSRCPRTPAEILTQTYETCRSPPAGQSTKRLR